MTNALAPRVPQMAVNALEDPERLGTLLAASGFFADTRDAAQAVVKVLAGAELGFGPIASMTGVNIIKGRVSISAFLMAATIRQSARYDYGVRDRNAERAEIVFVEKNRPCSVCEGKGVLGTGTTRERCRECGGTGRFAIGSSEFTTEMARTASLLGSENWKKYPTNMLFWRAMSNGAKFYCPDAFAGAAVYTPDELGANVDPETGELLGVVDLPTPAPDSAPPAFVATGAGAPPVEEPTPAPSREQTDPGANGAGGAPPATVEESSPSAPSPVQQASPDPGSAPAASPEGVTDEDVEAFQRLCETRGVPENLWRATLLVNDADTLKDLPVDEFNALVKRAIARTPEAT